LALQHDQTISHTPTLHADMRQLLQNRRSILKEAAPCLFSWTSRIGRMRWFYHLHHAFREEDLYLEGQ